MCSATSLEAKQGVGCKREAEKALDVRDYAQRSSYAKAGRRQLQLIIGTSGVQEHQLMFGCVNNFFKRLVTCQELGSDTSASICPSFPAARREFLAQLASLPPLRK